MQSFEQPIGRATQNPFLENAKVISKSFPELTDEQKTAQKRIIRLITEGYVRDAVEIAEKYPDLLYAPEIQSAAKEMTIKWLKYSNTLSVGQIATILESFSIPLNTPEVQAAAKKAIIKLLATNEFAEVSKIAEQFSIPLNTPEVQAAAKEKMMKNLKSGYIEPAIGIAEIYPDLLYAPEIQSAAKKGINHLLEISSTWLQQAISVISEKFSIPLDTPEVQVTAQKEIIRRLSNADVYLLNEISETFSVPLNTPEVQTSAKEEIIRRLERSDIFSTESVIEIAGIFPKLLDTPEVQAAAKKKLIWLLATDKFSKVLEIAEKLSISLDSPEVKETFRNWLVRMLKIQNVSESLEIAEKFPDLLDSPEIKSAAMEMMISSLTLGNLEIALEIVKKFSLPLDTPKVQATAKSRYRREILNGDYKGMLVLNRTFNIQDRAMELIIRDYGEIANVDLYNQYSEFLKNNKVPDDARSIGVKHSGEAGINELRRSLRNAERSLVGADEQDEKPYLNSTIVRRYLMSRVGFESAQWGNRSTTGFDQIVSQYLDNKDSIRRMPEEFELSQVYSIGVKDREAQDDFKWTEAGLQRYGSLLDSVKSARERYHYDHETNRSEKQKNTEGGLAQLQKEMRQIQIKVIEQLQKELASLESSDLPEKRKEFAKKNLEKKLEELERVNISSVDNPQQAFSALYEFPEFHKALREILFYFSFHLNPVMREGNVELMDKEHPKLDDLSWVMNFVEHITNKETFAGYFTDKEAAKKFKRLLNITALEEEMARMQNQKTKGTMKLQFVPSRNLLTELSGHIGDACWASKYTSILKEFPNLTSLTMVQNPDKEKDARFVGSCLLLETTSNKGEKLLVIRGLNPKENLINQLDVDDFYSKLVAYLKPIAERMGRQLAIVIDGHSGGSSTNRPVLFQYLDKKKAKLKQVTLESDKDTTFNAYNITKETFLC